MTQLNFRGIKLRIVSCDFNAVDRDGVSVHCRHDTWARHIVDEHREMEDQQGAVIGAIGNPAYIYQSERYPQRRLLYRPFILPKPFDRTYLLVVIEYRTSRGQRRGEVVTAFSAFNIKQRDILIWSKYETAT